MSRMNKIASLLLILVSACGTDPRDGDDVVTRRDIAESMAIDLCSIERCQRATSSTAREGFDACVARRIATTCENKGDGWCDAPAVDPDQSLAVCQATIESVASQPQGSCVVAEEQCLAH